MEKILDKLRSNIISNKRMIIFFSILIIIGIVTGSLFSVTISSNDKSLVSNYLENFFLSINFPSRNNFIIEFITKNFMVICI